MKTKNKSIVQFSNDMPPIAEAWNDKDGIYKEYRYDNTPPPDLINKLIERHCDDDICTWPDGVIIHRRETDAKVIER